MPDDCLFCRMASGAMPVDKVHEDDLVFAIRDINPQAPTHVLVVPREHVASLNEAADPALVGRVALFAAEVARKEGIAERGYRTVFNTNADAGQTVFHLHLHLLGGRHLGWPPG